MRKKFRKIELNDGNDWAWNVTERDNYYRTKTLKIWKNKVCVYGRSSDEDGNYDLPIVTPKFITKFINIYLKDNTMKKTKLNRKDFTFFWSGPFSQWYAAEIEIDGEKFNCNEQYMMYKKALLFEDEEVANAIMRTQSPLQQKALGRKVRGFDKEKWDAVCRKIVYDANYAKATQNQNILDEYHRTRMTEIVEASPEDKIWGIGLHESDERILDRDQWDGTNWLGEAIMQVRETLIKEGKM
jgi:ribA/ribD-fused uncharacterized protein